MEIADRSRGNDAMSPATLLRIRASDEPTTIAASSLDSALDFRTWNSKSDRFALKCVGTFAREEIVVLAFDRPHFIEFLIALIAVERAGLTSIIVDSAHLADESIRTTISSSGASAIVVPPNHETLELTWWTSWTRDMRIVEFFNDEFPLGVVRDDELDRKLPFPNETLQYILTSGTTGPAKLIGATSSDMDRWYRAMHRQAQRGKRRRMLMTTGIGTNATQFAIRNCLIPGTLALIVPETIAAGDIWKVIEGDRPEVLGLAPTTARPLLGSAFDSRDGSSLELVVVTSAPATPTLLLGLKERFPNAEVRNSYGTSEAGPASIRTTIDLDEPGLLGRPSELTDVRIANERGQEVGLREFGQICLREKSALEDRPWVRTGDMGFRDELGRIFLVDRSADLIISDGFKISSLQVEAALESLSGVKAAAAVAIDEGNGNQTVAAMVVAPNKRPDELIGAVRSRLPVYAVPRRIMLCEDLPITSAGKVNKQKVKKFCMEARTVSETIPTSVEIEALVQAAWQTVFDVGVGPDSDFFDLGGDSLHALELLHYLSDRLGIDLDVEVILEFSSVAAMTGAIQRLLQQ